MTFQTASVQASLKPTDTDLISKIRVGLALSTLLVIYVDPSEPQRFEAVTYATLLLYSAYSLVVYFAGRITNVIPARAAHWIDVLWFSVLIAHRHSRLSFVQKRPADISARTIRNRKRLRFVPVRIRRRYRLMSYRVDRTACRLLAGR